VKGWLQPWQSINKYDLIVTSIWAAQPYAAHEGIVLALLIPQTGHLAQVSGDMGKELAISPPKFYLLRV